MSDDLKETASEFKEEVQEAEDMAKDGIDMSEVMTLVEKVKAKKGIIAKVLAAIAFIVGVAWVYVSSGDKEPEKANPAPTEEVQPAPATTEAPSTTQEAM